MKEAFETISKHRLQIKESSQVPSEVITQKNLATTHETHSSLCKPNNPVNIRDSIEPEKIKQEKPSVTRNCSSKRISSSSSSSSSAESKKEGGGKKSKPHLVQQAYSKLSLQSSNKSKDTPLTRPMSRNISLTFKKNTSADPSTPTTGEAAQPKRLNIMFRPTSNQQARVDSEKSAVMDTKADDSLNLAHPDRRKSVVKLGLTRPIIAPKSGASPADMINSMSKPITLGSMVGLHRTSKGALSPAFDLNNTSSTSKIAFPKRSEIRVLTASRPFADMNRSINIGKQVLTSDQKCKTQTKDTDLDEIVLE